LAGRISLKPDESPDLESAQMTGSRLHNHQDDADQSDSPRSILRPSFLAQYKTELKRRWSGRQREHPLEGVSSTLRATGYACFTIAAILAVAFAWSTIGYAVQLSTYIRLASGSATQATVLRKHYEEGTSVFHPDRFIITYGFWSDDTGFINREEVTQQAFDALNVDDTVTVLYLARNPKTSRIKSQLMLPWPVAPAISLGLGIAFWYVGLKIGKLNARTYLSTYRRDDSSNGP
jgi:hypothetical protein